MSFETTLRQAPPGVYRLRSRVSAPALSRDLSRDGWFLGAIDGRRIRAKAELLAAIAEAFRFPRYFGANWDALADSLADLSWLPAAGYALLYDRPGPLIRAAPGDWAVARDIFAECAASWRARGIPLFVLLRGGGAAGLPEI